MRRQTGVWTAIGLAVMLVGCGEDAAPRTAPTTDGGDAATPRRVLVLGIDGMDPVLLRGLLDAGRMPHTAGLAARGAFSPLATSTPPQSPVAWSNVICGNDPGAHQIFDFIHRDAAPASLPEGVLPYLSTSRAVPPARDWAFEVGGWRLPLSSGGLELLRRGDAFWDHLVGAGVDATIYRMPANYPPPPVPEGDGRFRCLCGMGTPDLLGTYGEFTYFSPHAPAAGRTVPGGRLVHITVDDDRAEARLVGPANFLRAAGADGGGVLPPMTVPVAFERDPTAAVARVRIGDEQRLLNEGEWSGWIPLAFRTGVPGSAALGAMTMPVELAGMVRVYLKRVHPDFEVYVTPVNIDPVRPANPIAVPGGFADELAGRTGRYATTGIPEDTKALRSGVLDEDEFLAMCRDLIDERVAQFRDALRRFDAGCLFFYFGHIDQLSHVFWRDRDPGHPGRRAGEAERYGDLIDELYVEMDALVGEAVAHLDEHDVVMLISDHGFTSFRRGVNLNTWLLRNGYLRVANPRMQERVSYLAGVDWSATRAYALGLNALYLNMAGREQSGIVAPAEREALLARLTRELLGLRDRDGARVIERVERTDDLYPGADPSIRPDLLIGYARNYRASWATAEGAMPREVIEDNLDRWSGDHCVAAHLVPGILVVNRGVTVDDPDLRDVAPTLLELFGVPVPPSMSGRAILEP